MKKIYLNNTASQIFDPDYPLPNISFINHVSNEPHWTAGPVKHNNWCEVLYIKKGVAHYKINHRSYTVSEGDLLIFNEGILHEVYSDPDNPVERFACGLNDLHMIGRPKNHIISDNISPIISIGDMAPMICSLFEIIMHALTHPSDHSYDLCRHSICAILTYVDDIVRELPSVEYSSHNESLAHEIVSYIDNHYMEPITLRVLSRHFFISPDYLSHIVKKEYGFSPIDYLLNRRIGESIRLLMSSNFSIKTISEIVGYPNIHHFSTAFKKKMGISPSFFRQTTVHELHQATQQSRKIPMPDPTLKQ